MCGYLFNVGLLPHQFTAASSTGRDKVCFMATALGTLDVVVNTVSHAEGMSRTREYNADILCVSTNMVRALHNAAPHSFTSRSKEDPKPSH